MFNLLNRRGYCRAKNLKKREKLLNIGEWKKESTHLQKSIFDYSLIHIEIFNCLSSLGETMEERNSLKIYLVLTCLFRFSTLNQFGDTVLVRSVPIEKWK